MCLLMCVSMLSELVFMVMLCLSIVVSVGWLIRLVVNMMFFGLFVGLNFVVRLCLILLSDMVLMYVFFLCISLRIWMFEFVFCV